MTTQTSPPTIVWVPGILHGPVHMEPMQSHLSTLNIPSTVVPLPSTGDAAASYTPGDDVKAIRAALDKLIVDEGRDVVLVGHSYGGVPVSESVRGYEKSKRVKEGKKGGIVKAVWMAAFVLKKGDSNMEFLGREYPGGMPGFVDVEGPLMVPKPELCMEQFYHDIPEAEQVKYANALKPVAAVHAVSPLENPCWDVDVPKLYVHCTEDRALYPQLQELMLESVRDDTWTIEKIQASHSPFLSKKEELADAIMKGL